MPQLIKYFLVLLTMHNYSPLYADSVQIAFGSCYDQNNSSEDIWRVIAEKKPNLLILAGDNVYIDSELPEKFEQSYASLSNNGGFQALVKQTDVIATWDDHDYGLNDGGKHFKQKQMAKKYFVDFFGYSELQNIEKEDGIQHSREISVGDKTVRIIMLDTRWYRDDLALNKLSAKTRERFQLGPYIPHLDESKTLLGETQWNWLETILAKPVDLNIIVSSIQFISEYTAWELWANFPHERYRMLDLLNRYSPNKAVFISGDVHRAETSAMTVNGWELYDTTSSGLTSSVYPGKPNVHRIGEAHSVHNFGMFYLDNNAQGLKLKSVIYNAQGIELSSHIIPIGNIQIENSILLN